MEFMKKRKFLFTLSSGAVHDQDRNIRLVQDLIAFAHAKRTKFALIINPRCVNDNHRAKRQQFHGFVYRIRRSSHHRRNDRKILPGHSIDHTRFPGISFSKKTDMYPFRSRCLIHSHNSSSFAFEKRLQKIIRKNRKNLLQYFKL